MVIQHEEHQDLENEAANPNPMDISHCLFIIYYSRIDKYLVWKGVIQTLEGSRSGRKGQITNVVQSCVRYIKLLLTVTDSLL